MMHVRRLGYEAGFAWSGRDIEWFKRYHMNGRVCLDSSVAEYLSSNFVGRTHLQTSDKRDATLIKRAHVTILA